MATFSLLHHLELGQISLLKANHAFLSMPLPWSFTLLKLVFDIADTVSFRHLGGLQTHLDSDTISPKATFSLWQQASQYLFYPL